MKQRLLHIFCVALIYLSSHLLLQSCSSSEEEDADLAGESNNMVNEEATNEEGSDEYSDENNFNNGNEEGGNEYANEENEYGGDEGNDFGNNVANENGGNLGFQENNGAGNVLDDQETSNQLAQLAESEGEDVSEATNTLSPDMANSSANAAANTATGNAAEAPNAMPAIAAGPALPQLGSKMPYIVRVGDTMSQIAQRIYGDSNKWQEIAELTAISNPDLVKPGDVVYYQLNEQTVKFAQAYEGIEKVELTVQRGDTLSKIAERVYGQRGDWKLIWRHNAEIVNPDQLEVGQKLYYLAPQALTALMNFTKDTAVVKVVKKTLNTLVSHNLDKSINKTTKVHKQPQTNSQSTNVNISTTQPDTYVTGFDIAASVISQVASFVNVAMAS